MIYDKQTKNGDLEIIPFIKYMIIFEDKDEQLSSASSATMIWLQ